MFCTYAETTDTLFFSQEVSPQQADKQKYWPKILGLIKTPPCECVFLNGNWNTFESLICFSSQSLFLSSSLSSPLLIFSSFSAPSYRVNRQGLWWIQLSHLNFLHAATLALMTLQWRQTSCTLTYDYGPCIICVERDWKKSYCRLS